MKFWNLSMSALICVIWGSSATWFPSAATVRLNHEKRFMHCDQPANWHSMSTHASTASRSSERAYEGCKGDGSSDHAALSTGSRTWTRGRPTRGRGRFCLVLRIFLCAHLRFRLVRGFGTYRLGRRPRWRTREVLDHGDERLT